LQETNNELRLNIRMVMEVWLEFSDWTHLAQDKDPSN